jgi:hypothetical protein
MVVIARGKGGAYIVAELDGSVFQEQISQSRVIPYFARRELKLSQTVLDWIDISAQSLEALRKQLPRDENSPDFNFDKVKMKRAVNDDSSDSESEAENNPEIECAEPENVTTTARDHLIEELLHLEYSDNQERTETGIFLSLLL